MSDDKIMPVMDDYAAINAHAAKIAAEKAAAIANVDVTDALPAGATLKIEGGGSGSIFSPGPRPYAKREMQHLAERATDKDGVPDFTKARPHGQNEIYGRIKRITAWEPAVMATLVTGDTLLTDDQLTFAGQRGSICEHIHPGRKVLGISHSQDR